MWPDLSRPCSRAVDDFLRQKRSLSCSYAADRAVREIHSRNRIARGKINAAILGRPERRSSDRARIDAALAEKVRDTIRFGECRLNFRDVRVERARRRESLP